MSGLRGSSWWIAAGAGSALVVCVAASILYYFGANDPEAVFSPGPPPIAGVAAASPSAPSAPARDVDPDQTTPFHDFAMVGEKFAPEWLVPVERVYFADDGRLMAEELHTKDAPDGSCTPE